VEVRDFLPRPTSSASSGWGFADADDADADALLDRDLRTAAIPRKHLLPPRHFFASRHV
jgi:hypothetical protein